MRRDFFFRHQPPSVYSKSRGTGLDAMGDNRVLYTEHGNAVRRHAFFFCLPLFPHPMPTVCPSRYVNGKSCTLLVAVETPGLVATQRFLKNVLLKNECIL